MRKKTISLIPSVGALDDLMAICKESLISRPLLEARIRNIAMVSGDKDINRIMMKEIRNLDASPHDSNEVPLM